MAVYEEPYRMSNNECYANPKLCQSEVNTSEAMSIESGRNLKKLLSRKEFFVAAAIVGVIVLTAIIYLQ